ncbi:MAG: hypothetical protein AAGF26_12615 [Cyanobacteria bacterium P01_G01_bin.49]
MMLLKKTFLPLLTYLSILPLSLFVNLDSSNSLTSVAAETDQFIAQTSTPNSTFNNGVYVYGSSPQPEEIGQEYLVFKIEQGKVEGAIYQPQSEFNCFSGTLNPKRMDIAIVDPYDGNKYPYSIALQNSAPIAGNPRISEFGLKGYHRLDEISEDDHRILQTCLQES